MGGPIILLRIDEAAQAPFKSLVNSLCLAIALRVVGGAKNKQNSSCALNLFWKRDKNCVPGPKTIYLGVSLWVKTFSRNRQAFHLAVVS